MAPGRYEGVLRRVLGGGPIPEHPQTHVENDALMLFDQGIERGQVAAAGTVEEIVGRHSGTIQGSASAGQREIGRAGATAALLAELLKRRNAEMLRH